MSSSSNINCCVPLCNQRGTVDANGKRVGFFNFPKDPNLRAQWLQKIRRDVRTKFKLTEITNVCSLHFRESEIKNGLGGRKMRVDIHHHSSFEICMAHFTAKETAAVCKIREFTKPRRGRRGERRLKNQFMFYLRVSRYSEVIYFVYHCKSYRETKSGTQRSI